MELISKFVGEKIPEIVYDTSIYVYSKWKADKERLQSVESELQKLNNTRKSILALLSDAEERRYIDDESVLRWLRELKAVAFDIEDLNDEFETHKILAETPIPGKGKRAFDRRYFADRIQKIREEYERVTKGRNELRLHKGDAVKRFKPQSLGDCRQEGSLQDEKQFHGRKEETKDIIDKLLNILCSDNIQVISIVGSCGCGKTAIARNIFNDIIEKEVEANSSKKHFDLTIWVGLAQNFDLVRTIKEVIKAVEKMECHDSSLDLLQYHLKKIIIGKRFLLVLDNMWSEELYFWENLRIPLEYGAKGSKILVTTQNENVAKVMRSITILCEGLPVDDGWLLLQDVIFPRNERTEVFIEQPQLVDIGKDIVKKCQGFPLAIKAIGRLLCSVKDEEQWELLSKELMENEKVIHDIIPLLNISYDHLPLNIKQCFAFCSIFPKDYEFDKDELVKLWIAIDLIESGRNIKIEDVGGRYFDELLSWSFFQASNKNMNDRKKYRMPTVIYELAHHHFRYESLRMNKDETEHGESGIARYGLLYQHDKQSVTFNKFFVNKGLRALMLYGKNGVLAKEVLTNLFEKLWFLRLLNLSNNCLEELPDSLGNLILLRYLNLHGTNIKKLPETMARLYNLQTLELSNCHGIQELPDSIGYLKNLRYLGLHNTYIKRLPETVSNLSNLRTLELGNCYNLEMLPRSMQRLVNLRHLGLHLDWDSWDRQVDLISMPPGLGSLTSLRHVSRFVVGSEHQCGLGELEHLKLRGKLCITKLERVVNVHDAKITNLKDKPHIDSLMLRWSDVAFTKSETVLEDVINGLQPHENLKHLCVENYNGKKFPSWIGDPSFKKLETLKLINCKMCSYFPSVWNMPSLKTLQLKSLHGVKYFGISISMFKKLETFDVSDMPKLESWFIGGEMNCLTSLRIVDCPNLRWLSHLSPSIKSLELRNCQKLGVLSILSNL